MKWGSLFAIVFLAGGCGSSARMQDLSPYGMEYRLLEIEEPRPNRAHVLRVDFSLEKVVPVVVLPDDPDGPGPAEVSLASPLKMARGESVLAFVNTNPWADLPGEDGERNRRWYEGQPVDIHGLAASGGEARSPYQPGNVTVWVDQQGRVHLGSEPMKAEMVAEGVAGFGQIVQDGAQVGPREGPLHPRTAFGVNREGTVLWMVVVDGRQPGFSEGMTERELGDLMLKLGCWDAANMDGGGSSVMGVIDSKGRMQVVNSPSDRSPLDPETPKVRPLPLILTIREK
jgi:hypothetical protein